MEFVVLPHKDSKDVFILGGTDEIQQLLDDSNINIATIASSRHVGPIKSRVEDWSRQLDLFGKTLVMTPLRIKSSLFFRNVYKFKYKIKLILMKKTFTINL